MSYHKRARDPYWIVTRRPATLKDGTVMPAGSRAFYYPATRELLFGDEAERASSQLEAAKWDEDQYRAGYGV